MELNRRGRWLEMMYERGISVVLGADTHSPTSVEAHYQAALTLLQDVVFTKVSFL